MSGTRWTTGIGIALGGLGGALAALLGAPRASQSFVAQTPSAEAPLPPNPELPLPSSAPPSLVSVAGTSPAPPSALAAPPAASTASAPPELRANASPTLEVPTNREALLQAQILCDRKKSFDDCSRAAEALEKGSAGPPDPVQAKRFRRIALTHLVAECETGSPHACFVMAQKFRSGGELAESPARAAALEKRGLELCRLRSAPECPPVAAAPGSP